jgi:hypothetical protein
MAPAEIPTGFLRNVHRALRTAMAMGDSSVFAEDSWGFYIQQATEKGLKAWLLLLLPEQPPCLSQEGPEGFLVFEQFAVWAHPPGPWRWFSPLGAQIHHPWQHSHKHRSHRLSTATVGVGNAGRRAHGQSLTSQVFWFWAWREGVAPPKGWHAPATRSNDSVGPGAVRS